MRHNSAWLPESGNLITLNTYMIDLTRSSVLRGDNENLVKAFRRV